jgi:hypothetical protein
MHWHFSQLLKPALINDHLGSGYFGAVRMQHNMHFIAFISQNLPNGFWKETFGDVLTTSPMNG